MSNKEDEQQKDKQPGELRILFGLLIHFTNNNKINVFGGQKYVGYNIEPYGENHGYNLNTDRDNFIGFSESYIYCYRTYMGCIKSYPWGHSPRN